MIQKFFIENKSRITFLMEPDCEYDLKQKQFEKEKLHSMVSRLTDSEKDSIYNQGLELLKYQETNEGILYLIS
jgi:Zn-dependent M16 (insulinase) family peptidase